MNACTLLDATWQGTFRNVWIAPRICREIMEKRDVSKTENHRHNHFFIYAFFSLKQL
jgi:hypothetical protein